MSKSTIIMIRRTISVIALSLPVVLPARADDEPWNRFRGPNGNGISHATTVPVRWTERDYNWKVELPGPGHSSPVVWGKRIFVTCGDPATALRTLLCLDAVTGQTLWKREEPSKTYRQHQDNNYASATPAVDSDGVVITWSTPDAIVLLALNLEGRELWRRNLGPLISIQGSAPHRSCTETSSCWPTTRRTWNGAPAADRMGPIRRAGVS